MLKKLVEINRVRLRHLPPEEEERKKQFMRMNSEFMKQYHRL